MNVYISADLEGVLGVTSPHQCFPVNDASAYYQAVNQLVIELQTVIRALDRHGVQAITVNDSHGYMLNLLPLHLGNHVRLITVKPKPCAMSTGLDRSFDVALYIGYHSKAGTRQGVLCHSFHDQIFDLRINGASYGEGGVNALYASLIHQVPVGLVSGDTAVCAEMRTLIPGIETVETKQGISFSAAVHHPWQQVQQRYEAAVDNLMANLQALKHQNLLSLPAPYDLSVTLSSTQAADIACTMPWINRVDGRTVQIETADFEQLYRALQSIYAILAYPATPSASHLD